MVFGDSLSAGYGLPANKGWVTLLQQRIDDKQLGYQVINASISGDTTSGGVRRIDQALRSHHPVLVIIELGANDGLRGLSLKEMRLNLEKMIRKVKASTAKVLLVGMEMPPNYGIAFTGRFKKVYQQVSESEDIPLVPFLMNGFASDMGKFQRDGVHPNVEAQATMLDNVWPTLEKLL